MASVSPAQTVQYLIGQFKDPGSLRSLVLVLYLVKGKAVDDGSIDAVVTLLLIIMGLISFVLPPSFGKNNAMAHNSVAAAASVIGSAVASQTEARQTVTEAKDLMDNTREAVNSLKPNRY